MIIVLIIITVFITVISTIIVSSTVIMLQTSKVMFGLFGAMISHQGWFDEKRCSATLCLSVSVSPERVMQRCTQARSQWQTSIPSQKELLASQGCEMGVA